MGFSVKAFSQTDDREVLRAFLENMVKRRLIFATIQGLKAKGLQDEEIDRVLNGKDFKNFLTNVTRHERTQKAVDDYLNRTFNSRRIKAEDEKVSAQLRAEQQAALAQELNRHVRARHKRWREQRAMEEEPFSARVWRWLTKSVLE